MARIAKSLSALVVAVLLLGGMVGVAPVVRAQDGASDAVTTAGGYNPSRTECQFLALINRYRASRNEPKLSLSRPLGAAAEDQSRDMARRKRMYHTPNLRQELDRRGYDGNYIGENVAAGYSSAKAVFDGWRRSSGHNRNMLNGRFRAIGIAEQNGYWTTIFGDRAEQTVRC